MSNLLKQSLYSAYRDSPDILDLFDQLSFDKLTVQFNKELYSRITPEEQAIVERVLTSDLMKSMTLLLHKLFLRAQDPLQNCLI